MGVTSQLVGHDGVPSCSSIVGMVGSHGSKGHVFFELSFELDMTFWVIVLPLRARSHDSRDF